MQKAIEKIGYEKVIWNLEKIIALKKELLLDYSKEMAIKEEMEEKYLKDFWAGWSEYE